MSGTILKTNIRSEMKAFKSTLMASKESIQKAGTQAVNAGLSTFKTQSSKQVTLTLNITARQLKDKLFKSYPAKRKELTSSFVVNTQPINLIHFVVTPKNKLPIPQKGVPVKQRRKIRIRIFKGATSTLPKAFIAKGLRGKREQNLESFNYHVFRWDKSRAFPWVKRPGVSLYRFFSKQEFLSPIIKTTDARIRVVFNQKLKFFMLSEFDRNFKKKVRSDFL